MEDVNGFTPKELFELSWDKPTMAQLELTRNCNQSCVFCFQGCDNNEKYEDLSFEDWKFIINKLKKIGVQLLNFSGGENYLHNNFEEIVRWSKTQGFNVLVNTNGTYDISGIIGYVDEYVFSVHGLNNIHDRIVGVNGMFELVEANIAKASATGSKVSINMVLTKSNFDMIEDVFNYFNSKYNIFSFSPTISIESHYGSKEYDKLDINSELLERYFEILHKIPEEKLVLKHGLQTMYYNDLKLYKGSQKIPLPNCAAAKYKIIIDYKGIVYPCNFFKNDNFSCGNILNEDAEKIWKDGKGFRLFRDYILDNKIDKKCEMCVKKHKCYSGCRAWTKTYQGEEYKNFEGMIENECDSRCQLTHAFIRG